MGRTCCAKCVEYLVEEMALEVTVQQIRVRIAVLTYLALFFGSAAYVWIWFILHRHGVHDFPLGERVERFGDLLRFTDKHEIGKDSRIIDSEHLAGTLFPRNYPAFAVLIYLFLLVVCQPYSIVVMLGVFFCAVLIACTMVWRRVRPAPVYRWYFGLAIFATGMLGWGPLQVAMRGNIEGWMWIAICAGAWLYSRRHFAGAGVSFGLAMCIKPLPVLWLMLMARHKRFKEAGLGLLTWAGVTIASLLVIDRNPFTAYQKISGTSNFFGYYIAAFRPMPEMEGDHSLLQTMKTLARVVRNHGLHFSKWEYGMHANDPLALRLYHAYLPLAAVIGLVVLWKVWNMPVLNQIFALSAITTVLPMVAGGYTLTLVLIPLGFFAIFLAEDVATGAVPLSVSQMLWILLPALCVTATVPLGLLHAVFRCAALLVLLVASTLIKMPSRIFGEIDGQQHRINHIHP
jgi:hypothetical protein